MALNKRQPVHWAPVRAERDRRLDITDKYVAPDRGTDEQREQVFAYRKALRDITDQTPNAEQVVWPDAPPFIKELKNG